MRGAGEQVERLHFAHAVAVAFPFLERCRDFVGAAEHMRDADGFAHGKCVNHAGFAALAGRVQQNFFGFVHDRPRKASLHEHFVDLAGDKAVRLFKVLGRSLGAIDGWTFPFHAQDVLGGFAERKAEQSVSAVQVQEMILFAQAEHAACRLDQVVNLALVNLAESGNGVAQAELAKRQAHFARTIELLEIQTVCWALRFQIVIRFSRVHVGVCGSYLERSFFQCVRNQFELAHDACVNLLDVENHHAVLVSATNNDPVQSVSERLVSRLNQLFEQEFVNLVVFFGFEHRFLTVELQVAWLHVHAALARGTVAAGHGACNHLLRSARKAIDIPKFLDSRIFNAEFIFVVEHGERFAVGGICFAGVARNLMCNGLFEKHSHKFRKF